MPCHSPFPYLIHLPALSDDYFTTFPFSSNSSTSSHSLLVTENFSHWENKSHQETSMCFLPQFTNWSAHFLSSFPLGEWSISAAKASPSAGALSPIPSHLLKDVTLPILPLFSCIIKISPCRNFPGGPVVKTLPFNVGGTGLIPCQGAKIPYTLWPKNQNIKQKQYCNTFNKAF